MASLDFEQEKNNFKNFYDSNRKQFFCYKKRLYPHYQLGD